MQMQPTEIYGESQREGYLLSEVVQQSLHILQAVTIGNEEAVLLRHVRDVARSED